MKAYSQDLRQRVLRAIDQGKSQVEVAETFAISTSSIKRYLKGRRKSGHVLPKAIPGRPNVKGVALQAGLLEQLRAYPDARESNTARCGKPPPASRSALPASRVPGRPWAGHEKKEHKSQRAEGSRAGRLAQPIRRLAESGSHLYRRDRFPHRHDPRVCLCSARRARCRQGAAQLWSHYDSDGLAVAD